MPPYPDTKVLQAAVNVTRRTRPSVLSWFPRPLQILMQRCWQETPTLRPSIEEIKNELSLYKRECENDSLLNKPLPMVSKEQLIKSQQTHEPLRSLEHLVDEYLDTDKYHWDRVVKPKLMKLISRENPSSRLVRFSVEDSHHKRKSNSVHHRLPLMASESMSVKERADEHATRPLMHSADVSVSYNTEEGRQSRRVSKTGTGLGGHVTLAQNVSQNAPLHALGDSVQIDLQDIPSEPALSNHRSDTSTLM